MSAPPAAGTASLATPRHGLRSLCPEVLRWDAGTYAEYVPKVGITDVGGNAQGGRRHRAADELALRPPAVVSSGAAQRRA